MAYKSDAKLVLSDGTEFRGTSFGYRESAAGEVVFNTAMTGYPESLTDPSYKGQILTATYPLIGNYGVPEYEETAGMLKHFESERVQVSGLVISDYSFEYSHWNAARSLADWLQENKVPAVFGVDTRALTKHIREKGAMLGKIVIDNGPVDWYNPNRVNLVDEVSIKKPREYGSGRYRIALVDLGVKNNIIRNLIRRDATVLRVPWDYDFLQESYDGLFISNGPGDPKMADVAINRIAKAINRTQPIMGICLGTQLMALGTGANTYKLKYGHRSHNQPVFHHESEKSYITSQNHGFAIDMDTLSNDWQVTFTNLNDQTCEGIRHKEESVFAVQFHPEASSGPVDTEFLFDQFIEQVKTRI